MSNIVTNLILATAALERAGDTRWKILASYSTVVLRTRSEADDFRRCVETILATVPPNARGALVRLRDAIVAAMASKRSEVRGTAPRTPGTEKPLLAPKEREQSASAASSSRVLH